MWSDPVGGLGLPFSWSVSGGKGMHATLIKVLGVAFLACSAAASPPTLGQRAARCIEADRLGEAEALLTRLLAEDDRASTYALLGRLRQRCGDPVGALHAFRRALDRRADCLEARLGGAECWLALKETKRAARLAGEIRRERPATPRAWAVEIRALIDQGRLDRAWELSTRSLEVCAEPGALLFQVRGAVLFRRRRIKEAAANYLFSLDLPGDHLEAHTRLGGGFLPSPGGEMGKEIRRGLAALERGAIGEALTLLDRAAAGSRRDPMAHRLLSLALRSRRRRFSFLASHPAARALARSIEEPAPGPAAAALFPAYSRLDPVRRRVIDRVVAAWAPYMDRLLARGGRHDLLALGERTTDAPQRASLRGARTADGRYWDSVRGLGGLVSATGVENLDEAARFGFNTLAHEVTHQVHLYAMSPAEQRRIQQLYRQARKEGRCLDYYAATCPAEYFAQGFEAFLSLAKVAGCRRTQGHTRFELRRRDPELERFLRARTAWDPLAGPRGKERLRAAARVALVTGRFQDVEEAVALMGEKADAGARELVSRARSGREWFREGATTATP